MGDYLSHPDDRKHSDDGDPLRCLWDAGLAQDDGGLAYCALGPAERNPSIRGIRWAWRQARILFLKTLPLAWLVAQNANSSTLAEGHEVAMFCQKHMGPELLKQEAFKKGDYGKALKETFLLLDKMMRTTSGKEQLHKFSKQSPIPKKQEKGGKRITDPPVYRPTVLDDDDVAMYVGCTACVGLITPESVYIANAGDSRAVAAIKRSAYEMSEDHKPENKSERKRIEDANGFVEDNRVNGILNLSRSIGDFEYKSNPKLPDEKQMITASPDIREIKRSPDLDFLVIACDGIWDCLTNQQCVDFVYDQRAKAKPATPVSYYVENMFSKILAKDTHTSGGIGCDNMTCVVVLFK